MRRDEDDAALAAAQAARTAALLNPVPGNPVQGQTKPASEPHTVSTPTAMQASALLPPPEALPAAPTGALEAEEQALSGAHPQADGPALPELGLGAPVINPGAAGHSSTPYSGYSPVSLELKVSTATGDGQVTVLITCASQTASGEADADGSHAEAAQQVDESPADQDESPPASTAAHEEGSAPSSVTAPFTGSFTNQDTGRLTGIVLPLEHSPVGITAIDALPISADAPPIEPPLDADELTHPTDEVSTPVPETDEGEGVPSDGPDAAAAATVPQRSQRRTAASVPNPGLASLIVTPRKLKVATPGGGAAAKEAVDATEQIPVPLLRVQPPAELLLLPRDSSRREVESRATAMFSELYPAFGAFQVSPSFSDL